MTLDGSEQEITEQAIACIRGTPGLRDSLGATLQPREFLAGQAVGITYPQYQPISIVFDLGVSAALAGDDAMAVRLLETLPERTASDPADRINLYAKKVLAALSNGNDLTPIIEEVSKDNPKV